MKILLTVLLFCNLATYGQNKYVIEVNFNHSSNKMVYLSNAYGGPLDRTKAVHVDSTLMVNNRCTFEGEFTQLQYYSIAIGSKRDYVPFIIDNGKIVIKGDASNYLWKTTKVESLQNHWLSIEKNKVDSIQLIREVFQDSLLKYQNKSKKLAKRYSRLMDKQDSSMVVSLFSFTKQYPDSYYAFFSLMQIYKYTPAVFNLAKKIFPLFSARIKNSDEGKEFYSLLFEKKLLEGVLFPQIATYDEHTKIKTIKLHHQVYLIDYWASWCAPCIAKLPVLKRYKKRFEKKGFKLISISLDNNYNNWMAARERYEINWENYCNLKGFDSKDVKFFGIDAIPFAILVNSKGNIVKINPTDKYIENYLNRIYK
ncbi:TlpA disulfide reductase family protein [Mucilaginibacter panaciglaebae]|uniref:TlpA disulfide reductase family protein n=1 Tax=Mucilaginibacter panaciglaebae TaxID=502331 RepID=A0ABP7X2B7_9SPHI